MDSTTPLLGDSGFTWETLSASIAQKQPEAISLLNKVYHELFNETITQGCGNCYQKAFFRIQKYLYLQQQNHPLNNNSMTLKKRQYLLKVGRSLQTIFGGDTLTNDNLTDEAAAKLLKAYPTLIQHFERHPGLKEAAVAETPADGEVTPAPVIAAKKVSKPAAKQI